MLEKKPYLLYNSVQHYEWGTKGEEAFIPDLLGIKSNDKPYAELWIGAHPSLSSKIKVDGELIELRQVISKNPKEILGERVSKKFDNKLPFLLKILSAGKALSIQTHPNKEQAKELHLSDPKHYPDDNHKPEIAIVIDKLEALLGFRSYSEILRILNKYPHIKKFLGEEVVINFTQSRNKNAIKNIFSKLMLKSSDEIELKECIDSINGEIERKEKLSNDEQLFIGLQKEYGYDIGLIAMFFLNYIRIKKDEAIFTDAGIPHAYLKGNIIECMANSDNVVRAGLTQKFKDVNTLLKIINYDSSNAILTPRKNYHVMEYTPPIEEFKIEKINIENEQMELITGNQVEILLVMKGNIIISTEANDSLFKKGESVLMPATVNHYKVKTATTSTVFRILIP